MLCTPRGSSMAEIIVETERVILRRCAPGDVDLWLDHLNTPECTAHLGGVRTLEEVTEKFEKMDRSWEENGFSFLMVVLRNSGIFLGACGIARIENDAAPTELQGAVHVGWQLRADYWGQGYAVEAARAVMDFGFDRARLDCIYSQTSHPNRASWRVMEKLGMFRRADLDYNDPKYSAEDNPTIIYAITQAQWLNQAGTKAA
jgi:RimJ/RimL family protein N-acetyltransferase